MSVFDSYEHEGLKAVVHAALGTLAVVCCGYNALARVHRGYGVHLTTNALVYAAVAVYEVAQVHHHIKRLPNVDS